MTRLTVDDIAAIQRRADGAMPTTPVRQMLAKKHALGIANAEELAREILGDCARACQHTAEYHHEVRQHVAAVLLDLKPDHETAVKDRAALLAHVAALEGQLTVERITRDQALQARDDATNEERYAGEPWAWAVHDETSSIPCDEGGTCDYVVEYNKETADETARDHRDRLWDEQRFPTEEQCDAAVTVRPLYPMARHHNAPAELNSLVAELAEVEAERNALSIAIVKLFSPIAMPYGTRTKLDNLAARLSEVEADRDAKAKHIAELNAEPPCDRFGTCGYVATLQNASQRERALYVGEHQRLTRKLAEVEADRNAKVTRITELNAAMAKLARELPYPEELHEWTDQRRTFIAEIGTLRSKLSEVERELQALRRSYAESRTYVATLERERDFYVGEQQRLDAEVERLTACLVTANANHEKFERQYYLVTDEAEAMRAAAADNGRLADLLREQRDEAVAEAARIADALRTVLASAHPNKRDHPAMSAAWKVGEAALISATPPSAVDVGRHADDCASNQDGTCTCRLNQAAT